MRLSSIFSGFFKLFKTTDIKYPSLPSPECDVYPHTEFLKIIVGKSVAFLLKYIITIPDNLDVPRTKIVRLDEHK